MDLYSNIWFHILWIPNLILNCNVCAKGDEGNTMAGTKEGTFMLSPLYSAVTCFCSLHNTWHVLQIYQKHHNICTVGSSYLVAQILSLHLPATSAPHPRYNTNSTDPPSNVFRAWTTLHTFSFGNLMRKVDLASMNEQTTLWLRVQVCYGSVLNTQISDSSYKV